MPTILTHPGDVLKFSFGFVFVLASGGMYLLVERDSGHTTRMCRIPRSAQLVRSKSRMPHEVKVAFKAVAIAGQFSYSSVLDE